MSSDGHYISVMKGKSRAFWIVLAGVFLTAKVCDAECIRHSFKAHITDNLLIDHWFQMKNFTPTGEDVKVQHEFLSVINTICSSLLANEVFYSSNPINGSMRTKVVWTYVQMVKTLVNSWSWDKNDTIWFCHKHSCFESYGTSFINTTQFENIYKKVCKWNGLIPECPFPQNHSGTTAAVIHTSTPPASEPGLQTFSESTNGNVSRPPIKYNALNLESQRVSSGLVVSVVVTIILISLIVSVTVYHHRRRYERDVQAPVNQEFMFLQNGNTGTMAQDQNNTESHEEDVV